VGLNEGLHDTSWQNEEGDKITLLDLLNVTNNIPVTNIPVDKLKHMLLTWDGDNSEIEKIEMANLDYPILIFVNNEGHILSIVDGHHRAQKAVKQGLETIKCKLIPINSLPNNVRRIFKHIK
jgi:hypothetical protein